MFILPFFIHLQIKKRGLVGTIECAIIWRFCRRFVFCEVPILINTSHLGTLSVEIERESFSNGGPLSALHLFMDVLEILLFRDYSKLHSPFCDPCNMNMVSSLNA